MPCLDCYVIVVCSTSFCRLVCRLFWFIVRRLVVDEPFVVSAIHTIHTRDDVPVWLYPENFCVHSSLVKDDVVFLFTSLMFVSQYTATTEVGVSLLLYADTIDS